MSFDEGTKYKASNGQVFFIEHFLGTDWHIREITDAGYGVDNYFSSITATSYSGCVAWIENEIKEKEESRAKAKEREEERRAQEEAYFKKISDRVTELKQAFEESGRKQNYADPSEIDNLNLTLTEKKIMQQCKRPKCNGCKLGWICPKFWSE